jgi:hypothetical protein
MEAFDNPNVLLTLLLGAVFLAGVSTVYQLYGPEAEGAVKPKAVVRDGLLGAIFTGMAWTFVPESMDGAAKSLLSVFASSPSTQPIAKSVSFMPDFDVQVGPARF